jgi:hypothetical protein
MKLWTFGMLAVGAVLLGGIWLVSNKNKPTASQAPTHATQPNPIPLNPELTNSANQFAFNLLKQLIQPDYHARQKPPLSFKTNPPIWSSPLWACSLC